MLTAKFHRAAAFVISSTCCAVAAAVPAAIPTQAAPLVNPSYFESADIFGLEWASNPQL